MLFRASCYLLEGCFHKHSVWLGSLPASFTPLLWSSKSSPSAWSSPERGLCVSSMCWTRDLGVHLALHTQKASLVVLGGVTLSMQVCSCVRLMMVSREVSCPVHTRCTCSWQSGWSYCLTALSRSGQSSNSSGVSGLIKRVYI